MTYYGPKITDDEYQGRIVSLYSSESLTSTTNDEIYRKELDLTIDHRLGCKFPQSRRDELWEIHKKLNKRQKWLSIIFWIISQIGVDKRNYAHTKLANFLLKEYNTVLSPEEMKMFFGE